MRIKIVFQSLDKESSRHHHTEVWSGEWDIQTDKEYLAKVSVLAEGEPHPICDIPFALGIGYWTWMSPEVEYGSGGHDAENDLPCMEDPLDNHTIHRPSIPPGSMPTLEDGTPDYG